MSAEEGSNCAADAGVPQDSPVRDEGQVCRETHTQTHTHGTDDVPCARTHDGESGHGGACAVFDKVGGGGENGGGGVEHVDMQNIPQLRCVLPEALQNKDESMLQL
jgi:hypothetical protein